MTEAETNLAAAKELLTSMLGDGDIITTPAATISESPEGKVIEGVFDGQIMIGPDGKNYYIDKNGSFWRLRNFLDAVTFNTCDDIAVLENAGRAFGRFQNMLSDFDASVLCETIPGFHNTVSRMETLFEHAS